jgi:transcriptional regulator with GAF, ATPase, and Fis domain
VEGEKTLKDTGGEPLPHEPRQLGPLLFRLLCADDLRQPPARFPLARAAEVAIGRDRSASARLEGARLAIGMPDPYSSSRHSRLESPGGSWHVLDEGSTNGTWLNGQRIAAGQRVRLADGDVLEAGHTFFLFRASAQGDAEMREREGAADDPLTLQPEWEHKLARLADLARTSHEILLQGESGVGKEVLARAIHTWSGRKELVSVNCGAVAETLLEDELFGHLRGAFSGAHADRPGLIRAADGGTLFLDEVGDMPLGLQVKLLRFLEDHRVRPVGGEREVAVDVRVIAATNRDLGKLAAQGRFREDVLARLGLLPIRIPAVRERREDLGLLVRAVLRAASRDLGRVRFTTDALRLVLRYSWPLNVRELRRSLLSACDLAAAHGGGEAVIIAPDHLPAAVRELRAPVPAEREPARARAEPRESDEELRQQLVALLTQFDGNVSAVAREMRKGRTQIQRWIARFGIDTSAVRHKG